MTGFLMFKDKEEAVICKCLGVRADITTCRVFGFQYFRMVRRYRLSSYGFLSALEDHLRYYSKARMRGF